MAYKAKTITGAQARVRQLENLVRQYDRLSTRLNNERNLMAKMAADGPCFFNPLDAMAAKVVRDRILKEIGHKPDGTPIT
jgi:hypothetical protein